MPLYQAESPWNQLFSHNGRAGSAGTSSDAWLDRAATTVRISAIPRKAPRTTRVGGRPDRNAGARTSATVFTTDPPVPRVPSPGRSKALAYRAIPHSSVSGATRGVLQMNLALLAVGAAAVCSGSAAVLQASAVSRLPTDSMNAGFVVRLARSPRYLLALVLVAG